jgi:hypothetical protein
MIFKNVDKNIDNKITNNKNKHILITYTMSQLIEVMLGMLCIDNNSTYDIFVKACTDGNVGLIKHHISKNYVMKDDMHCFKIVLSLDTINNDEMFELLELFMKTIDKTKVNLTQLIIESCRLGMINCVQYIMSNLSNMLCRDELVQLMYACCSGNDTMCNNLRIVFDYIHQLVGQLTYDEARRMLYTVCTNTNGSNVLFDKIIQLESLFLSEYAYDVFKDCCSADNLVMAQKIYNTCPINVSSNDDEIFINAYVNNHTKCVKWLQTLDDRYKAKYQDMIFLHGYTDFMDYGVRVNDNYAFGTMLLQ